MDTKVCDCWFWNKTHLPTRQFTWKLDPQTCKNLQSPEGEHHQFNHCLKLHLEISWFGNALFTDSEAGLLVCGLPSRGQQAPRNGSVSLSQVLKSGSPGEATQGHGQGRRHSPQAEEQQGQCRMKRWAPCPKVPQVHSSGFSETVGHPPPFTQKSAQQSPFQGGLPRPKSHSPPRWGLTL